MKSLTFLSTIITKENSTKKASSFFDINAFDVNIFTQPKEIDICRKGNKTLGAIQIIRDTYLSDFRPPPQYVTRYFNFSKNIVLKTYENRPKCKIKSRIFWKKCHVTLYVPLEWPSTCKAGENFIHSWKNQNFVENAGFPRYSRGLRSWKISNREYQNWHLRHNLGYNWQYSLVIRGFFFRE